MGGGGHLYQNTLRTQINVGRLCFVVAGFGFINLRNLCCCCCCCCCCCVFGLLLFEVVVTVSDLF